MKRILFLDDDKARHEHFDKLAKGADVMHVWTAWDCIDVLRDNPKFDAVFLDHDLADFNTHGDDPGDGMDVAKFINLALSHDKIPDMIIIHSWNVPGAIAMEKEIKRLTPNVKRVQFSFS